MNPIAAAVSRPYTVAVGVILVGIASWLAVARIPVQLKPTVDIPRISVTTSFRGASAAEVEEQVTRELEEVLQNVEGLVEMVSTSLQGTSTVTLEFEYGFDTRAALVDVINKLSQVPRLPPEADEPGHSLGRERRARRARLVRGAPLAGPQGSRTVTLAPGSSPSHLARASRS
jgi:HAE1 family hydrophobic/amphiphilic exporter-1